MNLILSGLSTQLDDAKDEYDDDDDYDDDDEHHYKVNYVLCWKGMRMMKIIKGDIEEAAQGCW